VSSHVNIKNIVFGLALRGALTSRYCFLRMPYPDGKLAVISIARHLLSIISLNRTVGIHPW
jgi:hypothetical protein